MSDKKPPENFKKQNPPPTKSQQLTVKPKYKPPSKNKDFVPSKEHKEKFYWLYNKTPKKFDDDARRRCLEMVATHGRVALGARAAGVSIECVNLTKRNDENFAAQLEEAFGHFRDRLEERVQKLAVEGWEEMVVSKGMVVQFVDPVDGVVKPLKVHKYDSRLLEMVLRRHDPAYRKESSVDVNVGGGLLLIPNLSSNGKRMTPEEFEAAFAHEKHEVIDVEGVTISVEDAK